MSFAHFISDFLDLLRDAVPWFLFGAILGTALEAFVKPGWILRWVGSHRASVVYATVAGAVLPGCSLTTVPLAVSLKSQGARLGTLTAFIMISPILSPEIIMLTAAMLGWKMTAARILVPFVMSIALGMILNLLESRKVSGFELPNKIAVPNRKQDGCADSCEEKSGFWQSLRKLLHPLWVYLVVGLFVAALLKQVFSPTQIAQYLHGGFLAYLLAAVIGIPLYVGGGAEVPLTFSLLKMGVGPGPAFTFLLAAVGTCIPTIAMATRVIGWNATYTYVATWLVLAIGGGWLLSLFF